MKRLFLLLLIVLLISCSSKGEEKSAEEEKKEKGTYPDVILSNASYYIGEEDSEPIVMTAKKIIFYSSDGMASVEDMVFSSIGEDGNEKISGSAGGGRIDTEGKKMDLWGGVVFMDKEGGMKITGERLLYDTDEDTIVADGSVVVESEEGIFRGRDFRGDLRTGTYTFSSIEEGELNFE
ncbi:MAG: LPS export ABC transporter periplasmic protein LptC [Candidatus Ornithospirochaeta sp.]